MSANLPASRYPDSIDLKLMAAVGENLPQVVRGEITMLEPMVRNNMLTDFYVDALGMREYLGKLALMSSHIGHKYPQMNILEIGKGWPPLQCETGTKRFRCGDWWSNEGDPKTAERRFLLVSTSFRTTLYCFETNYDRIVTHIPIFQAASFRKHKKSLSRSSQR
jgi:hypothetical protein